MSWQAFTVTELAGLAGVAKQTMSSHFAKLAQAELSSATSQGRHRYFRIASEDVAYLLETLMGIAFKTGLFVSGQALANLLCAKPVFAMIIWMGSLAYLSTIA